MFIGVVGEVLTERKLILKNEEEKRDAIEGVASWVLVFGLAISLAALIGTNGYFKGTIASLNLQAQQAEERAAKDEKEAASFQSQIADSNARVKEAEAKVTTAEAESREASAKVAKADARIAEAQQKAAEANRAAESERLARVRMEQRLAWRNLTTEQAKSIAGKLLPFEGQLFDFVTYPDNGECINFENLLYRVVSRGGWVLDPNRKWQVQMTLKVGIVVEVSEAAGKSVNEAALALVSALNG